MIDLARETQELIREQARLAGTSPDDFVREAVAAFAAAHVGPRGDRSRVMSVLAAIDTLPRSSDHRLPRSILDEAWSS
jgi:uncharacterized protein (DUF1778 family)